MTSPGARAGTIGVDPAAPRPDVGFRMHVPDAWLALDLDPATSDGWVEWVLDARVAEHPEASRHRGHMRRILQGSVAEQRAAGVFFAAVLAAGSRPAEMIGANLSLSWQRLTSASPDIDFLARYFGSDDAAPGESVDARSVHVVDLPAGPAVRIRTSLLAPVPESSRRQRVAATQLVIPVPGTPWLGILVVSTPNLGLADAFADLADEVGQSLQFLSPDEADQVIPAVARPSGTIGYVPAARSGSPLDERSPGPDGPA
jgi:hypothetical protein